MGTQTCPTHQVSVENLPDVKGYASSDAFVKHPTIEGLFKVYVVLNAPVCLLRVAHRWHVALAG